MIYTCLVPRLVKGLYYKKVREVGPFVLDNLCISRHYYYTRAAKDYREMDQTLSVSPTLHEDNTKCLKPLKATHFCSSIISLCHQCIIKLTLNIFLFQKIIQQTTITQNYIHRYRWI